MKRCFVKVRNFQVFAAAYAGPSCHPDERRRRSRMARSRRTGVNSSDSRYGEAVQLSAFFEIVS